LSGGRWEGVMGSCTIAIITSEVVRDQGFVYDRSSHLWWDGQPPQNIPRAIMTKKNPSKM